MISLNLQLVEPLESTSETSPELKDSGNEQATVSTQDASPQPDLAAITDKLQIGLGNRYEVQEPLAIGGMSTVLQLRHRLHGGLFVAKVLHAWLVDQPGMRSRFRDEALFGVALAGQPHIVPVVDLGEVDGLLYTVLPYVEGEDLDRILQRVTSLQRAELLILLSHMASALLATEKQGIVHGDISSGNIRLDEYGQYRLMDFGLARRIEDGDRVFQGTARTPLYASPEQWRGDVLDVRSDLYNLGVVLLEAAAGASLLAESDAAIEQKHLAGQWTLPESLQGDPAWPPLLKKLLAVDKEQRLQSAGELAATLAAMGMPLIELREKPLAETASRKAPKQRNRLSQMG